MSKTICLNDSYSTTKLLVQEAPIVNDDDNTLETLLFLKPNKTRIDEGGLRTQGYYKQSYTGKPLISVVTVVYNGEKYLEQTILSVINQSYDNVEYIIIDGGSTDATLDIIKKYEEAIDYWVSEPDDGIYDAMNKGIHLAHGSWLNFMNAGDVFHNKDVLKQILTDTTLYKSTDLIYSDVLFDGKRLGICNIEKNVINHQALIYRRSVHYGTGLYLVSSDLLISDYIFFMLAKTKRWTKTDIIIADYDTTGLSGNKYFMNHFKQKIGIDLVFNNISRSKASRALITYPMTKKFRKLLQGIRDVF